MMIVYEFATTIYLAAGLGMERSTPAGPPLAPAGYMKLVLLLAGLVMVFVLGAFILVRASRRFQERIRRTKPQPTPWMDIWKMHRLPDDIDLEPDEPPPGDRSGE